MKLYIWSLLAALLAAPLGQEPPVDPAPRTDAASRFLARNEPPVTQAVALRHLVATTRGGAMSGWVDACTALEAGEFRYWIVDEGGSGAVRKRALIAALDGEVNARKENVTRAALDPSNYEFAPETAENGLLRVGLTPRRKETMLIDGAMLLAAEDPTSSASRDASSNPLPSGLDRSPSFADTRAPQACGCRCQWSPPQKY